jgi:hypothetical protein
MNILYIDCINSGISGDMFLAALLELLPNHEELLNILKELKDYLKGVSKLKIKLKKVKKNELWVNQLQLKIKESKAHRSVKTLKDSLHRFLKEKRYSRESSEYAINVLDDLIKAEAQVHDKLENKIHLHELSSVDTLIDILGVSKALEDLGIFSKNFKIYCSELPVGGGTIKAAHGLIPIPAPATVNILEKSTLKVTPGPIQSELSTPTGVALLANLNPISKKLSFHIHRTSQSIGQKSFPNFLNMLRLFIGERSSELIEDLNNPLLKYREKVSVIETNIDDVSGEIIGDFIEIMENEQVLDVQVNQCITKKNRPSYIIKVLTKPESKYHIIEKIIDTLGTLGVRYYTIDRICVAREIKTTRIKIDKAIYPIKYKLSYILSKDKKEIINIKPEYDDLRKLREETGYSVKELQRLFFNSINLDKEKEGSK